MVGRIGLNSFRPTMPKNTSRPFHCGADRLATVLALAFRRKRSQPKPSQRLA